MRRQFQRSFYWIMARPLAWLVGFGFLFLGSFIHTEFVFDDYVVPIAIAGAVFGLGFAPLAGAIMVWITRDASRTQCNSSYSAM
jgi:hypothetical protein